MRNFVRETAKSLPNSRQDASGEWTQVAGLRIRFAHAGSGPALVLVHGLLGYSFSWRQVIPTFAGQFEVFAPDLPGAGFSDNDVSLDCRLSSAGKRLLGFLDAVSIRSCDLVGSSYGGTTSLMLAALAPSRVRRLVLVLAAATFPGIARPMQTFHDYFLRRMWGDPRRITPEIYRGYSAPLGRRGTLEHAVKIVRTWWHDMRELQAILPQISHVPTLLVWGSKDRTVDPASVEPLRRYFQSAQVAIIEGAGHLPYEECPEEFNRIVLEFLQSGPTSAVPTGK